MTERRLEKRVELDATPEQVWEAIATGPGVSAWFVPTEVEPREGGAVTQKFGEGFEETCRVTAWEPATRFAYGASEIAPAGAANYAFEFLVEGRDGGGTVLRFVQTGFPDEGWEDEYHGLDRGWELFFDNLRAYLAHFAGRPVANVVTMGFAVVSAKEAWRVLYRALGLTGPPTLGEEITLAPDGPDPINGVVDVSGPEFLGVRSAHGLHRIGAEGGDASCGVSAYHYFYGSDGNGKPVDVVAQAAAWQDWLVRHFPAPVA